MIKFGDIINKLGCNEEECNAKRYRCVTEGRYYNKVISLLDKYIYIYR